MGIAGRRRVVGAALCGLVLGCVGWVTAPSAYASCAESPEPSPHRFTGTVIAVEDDGSMATVDVDTGQVVTVFGGPGSPGRNVSSSVDRRYVVGGRYEFHPVNDKDPYRDNACTATRQLAGPSPAPAEPAEGLLPAWLPIDEAAGPTGYALFFGPVAVAVVLAGLAVWRMRRTRTRRHGSGEARAQE
jgi:hypothetical protein